MVVGRRVGGGVDDVDAHPRATIGPPWRVEVSFCVVNTEQRELLVRCLDAIAAERATLPFETEVLVLDNASQRRLGRRRAAPPGRRPSVDRAGAPARQGRERHRAAAARPRALRAAAQRGLRAAARRDGRAARRAGGATRRRRPPGRRLLRPDGTPQPSAWRFPTPVDGAGRRAVPAPPPDRAEPRRRDRARSTGRSRRRCWSASTRRATIGWFDPRVLRLLRRGRLLPAPARRRLVDAVRPRCGGRPPRAALDRRRCPSGGSSSSRATATATCASTTRAAPRGPCAC